MAGLNTRCVRVVLNQPEWAVHWVSATTNDPDRGCSTQGNSVFLSIDL